MVRCNRAQRVALANVFRRKYPHANCLLRADQVRLYRKLRRSVVPGPDCVMVPALGVWLGIEPDGYTHS